MLYQWNLLSCGVHQSEARGPRYYLPRLIWRYSYKQFGLFHSVRQAGDVFGNPDPFIEVEYEYSGAYG